VVIPRGRLLPSGRKVPPPRIPGGICDPSKRPGGKRSGSQRRRESAGTLGGTIPAGQPLGAHGGSGSAAKGGVPKKFTKSQEDKIKTLLRLGDL